MKRRRWPDAVALTFAVAVHCGVFLLLALERSRAPQRPAQSDLALFDVRIPPPQPLPKPARQRLPRRPATLLPGGSRPAAAPPVVQPADAAPRVPALFLPRQWPVLSPIDDQDDHALLASAQSSDPDKPGNGGDEAGTGTGNGTGPGSLRFARADWIREPDLNDVKRYLPSTAPSRSFTVSVELGCIVPTPGKPKRCWVVSENPRGFGFGHAAVAMSSRFRIRPVSINDAALDLPVLVPILFQVRPRPSPSKP